MRDVDFSIRIIDERSSNIAACPPRCLARLRFVIDESEGSALLFCAQLMKIGIRSLSNDGINGGREQNIGARSAR